MNEHVAYRKLINIKYDLKKETGFEIISRFERTVRQYESYSKTYKFPNEEKRKLFYNAVEQAILPVVIADVVSQNSREIECDYNALKNIVLKVAPRTVNQTNAMHTDSGERRSGERRDEKCYNCNRVENEQFECQHKNKVCIICNKEGHIQYHCPLNNSMKKSLKRAYGSGFDTSLPRHDVKSSKVSNRR